MSNTGRNFVIAYILLVGIPLLGLAGVLKSGRHLTAPISIDGTWRIEADASRIAGQPCSATLSSLVHSSLLISQSGKNLQITFNTPSKTLGSGFIEGKTVSAATLPLPDAARESGCGAEGPVLTASVDPKADPRTLTGQLTVAGCASCGSLEFRAMRQPRAEAAGGAH